MPPSERFLDFNETSNAQDYFTRALHFLRQTPEDPYAWKWAFIALHSALYGFAIIACAGSDYFQVLIPKKNKKLTGDENLISCRAALIRLQDPKCFTPPLVLTDSQKRSIRLLNDVLRNKFMHYIPCGWTIEMSGVTTIIEDVTFVVEHIALNMGMNVQLRLFDRHKILHTSLEIHHFLKHCSLNNEKC